MILLIIVALGFSIGLQSLTIIDWWKPTALCMLLAIPATAFLARYMACLTRPMFRYLEYPAAFLLSFSILIGTFYCINYFLSDPSTRYEYEAPVVRKYSEVRTRSHKTGKRSYREEHYRVYIVEIQMEDGKIKKLEKPLRAYNRIKEGGTLRLLLEDGLFGIRVIKNN